VIADVEKRGKRHVRSSPGALGVLKRLYTRRWFSMKEEERKKERESPGCVPDDPRLWGGTEKERPGRARGHMKKKRRKEACYSPFGWRKQDSKKKDEPG